MAICHGLICLLADLPTKEEGQTVVSAPLRGQREELEGTHPEGSPPPVVLIIKLAWGVCV